MSKTGQIIIAAVVAVIVISITMGWYFSANYIPKPEPYDARSVYQGILIKEAFQSQFNEAARRKDTVAFNMAVERQKFFVDSLKKEIGQ